MAYVETFPTVFSPNVTGLLNSQQINKNKEINHDLELGIVTKIYPEDPSRIEIFSIFSYKTIDNCIPITKNVNVTPIRGELVVFREYMLGKKGEKKYFYEPLSWNNSVHANDSQDALNYILEKLKKGIGKNIDIEKVSGEVEQIKRNVGQYYKIDKKYNTKLIQFEGNIIFEGRNGQTIRFGSAIPKKIKFDGDIYNKANWFHAKSETGGGNPFIIISSGKTNIIQNYALEDIQNDPASIFLTAGGSDGVNIPFSLSSRVRPKLANIPSTYNDNMIILNSDRLILNSKQADATISSQRDIIVLGNRNIVLSAQNTTEISSEIINLGESANDRGQSVVKDKDLMQFLLRMISAILMLKYTPQGVVIPGTDSTLKILERELNQAVANINKTNVFSSKTTFTL